MLHKHLWPAFLVLSMVTSAVCATAAPADDDNPRDRWPYRGAAWSPDGAQVAVASSFLSDELAVIDAATLETKAIMRVAKPLRLDPSSTPVGIAWQPDGRGILTAGFGDGITLWSADDLQLVKHFPDSGGHCAIALDATGELAISSGAGVATVLWDVASGRPYTEVLAAPSGVIAVALTPDGRVAATADMKGVIRIWDVATRTNLFELPGPACCADAVGFGTDGSSVVWSASGTVGQWHFEREAAQLERDLAGDKLLPGQRIAMAERAGSLRFLDRADDRPTGYPAVALTTAGDYALLRVNAGRGPTLVVYELSSGRELNRIRGSAGGFMSISPDGTRILQGDLLHRLTVRDARAVGQTNGSIEDN